jgi:hypothetical protein
MARMDGAGPACGLASGPAGSTQRQRSQRRVGRQRGTGEGGSRTPTLTGEASTVRGSRAAMFGGGTCPEETTRCSYSYHACELHLGLTQPVVEGVAEMVPTTRSTVASAAMVESGGENYSTGQ